ncbi:MAG: LysR family transcriptional regulator [Alphaproteobacteria bacterium]|nr:LysR family transcriptional regulator [Alphaproteobacteria bacterium]
MDLVAFQAFVSAVDHGTITGAAAALGLSRPTVSRRLADLEASLGLALLHRTTRRVRPTAAGRQLYARVRPLLDAVEDGVEALVAERDGVVGRLVVSVPPPIAREVAALAVRLTREHPALEVELRAEVGLADLRTDQVEVALRAGRLEDPDLVQRRLARRAVRAVATPAYLAAHGRPTQPEELADHTLLEGLHPNGTRRGSWPLQDGRRVAVAGRFRTSEEAALLEAVLQHGGIALLSEVTYARPLAEGRVELVLPEVVGTTLDLHAVFARRSLQPARVRAFVDAAVAWFGRVGPPPDSRR